MSNLDKLDRAPEMPMEGEASPDRVLRTNAGWIAGGLVIVGVFLVGLGLWIRYHP